MYFILNVCFDSECNAIASFPCVVTLICCICVYFYLVCYRVRGYLGVLCGDRFFMHRLQSSLRRSYVHCKTLCCKTVRRCIIVICGVMVGVDFCLYLCGGSRSVWHLYICVL